MKTRLELAAVTKAFGRRQVLNQAWLQVRSGETVGLIGANGAGKTTLLRIAAGLMLPDGGSVRWSSMKDEDRARVRYYGGEMTLPPAVRIRRWTSLFDVPLDDRRRIGQLSRGTRQLLGLRVVLSGAEADLVLLDEPWEGLDPEWSAWLIEQIRRWRAGGAGDPDLVAPTARPRRGLHTLPAARRRPLSRGRGPRAAAARRSAHACRYATGARMIVALVAVQLTIASSSPGAVTYRDVPPEVVRISMYEWQDEASPVRAATAVERHENRLIGTRRWRTPKPDGARAAGRRVPCWTDRSGGRLETSSAHWIAAGGAQCPRRHQSRSPAEFHRTGCPEAVNRPINGPAASQRGIGSGAAGVRRSGRRA